MPYMTQLRSQTPSFPRILSAGRTGPVWAGATPAVTPRRQESPGPSQRLFTAEVPGGWSREDTWVLGWVKGGAIRREGKSVPWAKVGGNQKLSPGHWETSPLRWKLLSLQVPLCCASFVLRWPQTLGGLCQGPVLICPSSCLCVSLTDLWAASPRFKSQLSRCVTRPL